MQIGSMNTWNRESGILVSIDGIDGSGKSSVAKMVSWYLRERRIATTIVRMPSPWYRNHEPVRNANQSDSGDVMSDVGMALFLATDKIESIFTTIIPMLNNGIAVLCDRYIYSSFAHWRARATVSNEWHEQIYRVALIPDVRWLVDIDPLVAHERILQRGRSRPEHYEENFPYMSRVRDAYLDVAKEYDLIVIKNTDLTKAELERLVNEKIEKQIEPWLSRSYALLQSKIDE